MTAMTVPASWHRRGRPGPRGKPATAPASDNEAVAPLPARRRARHVPEIMISEDKIQQAVISHLQLRAWPDAVFWHVPNGGARSKAEAARFKAQGVVAGIPDVHILFRGRLYVLELKTETGRWAKHQQEIAARMETAGAIVAVAWGLDAALAQIEAWGLLRS